MNKKLIEQLKNLNANEFMKLPEFQLTIFQQLRFKLNGNCSKSSKNCPVALGIKYYKQLCKKYISWDEDIFVCITNHVVNNFCYCCLTSFGWLATKQPNTNCPCLRVSNPEEVLLRLDEYIDELHQEVRNGK